MLHDVNQPDCAVQFEAIKRLQRNMLDFACSSTTPYPLTQAMVEAKFGGAGTWMWNRVYTKVGELTAFGKLVVAVVAYARIHPELHQATLNSFDHDTSYNQHIDDTAFRFQYQNNVASEARTLIRPLMEAFYEDLLASGFPECVHGLSGKFSRDELVKAFWKANPYLGVCPACSGSRPDAIGDKVFADTDHVLPKSIYPFLSVHPINLLPICVACNRSFKGNADPARDSVYTDPLEETSNAPLQDTFLPYLRPAINAIDVHVSRNTHNGDHRCDILEHDGKRTSRINTLNRVLKLEERWNSRLDRAVTSVRDELSFAGRRERRSSTDTTPDALKLALEDMLDNRHAGVAKQPDFILQGGYLNYALTNDDEFAELFDTYSGDHVQRARVPAVLASE